MILPPEQLKAIILKNPGKERVEKGREIAKKLLLHVHGFGMDEAIKRCDHFENHNLFTIRKKYAISNKDMFGRLLEQESQVFSAKGGSIYFNLEEKSENQMHSLLSSVNYGLSLRKWMERIAIEAYRCDPMGVILIEAEAPTQVSQNGQISQPKAYPTYKSIFSIYDYDFTGRKLEYIVFQLKASEAIKFGVIDEQLEKMASDQDTKYFRVLDDAQDVIMKRDGDTIMPAILESSSNPIINKWGQTPGFIVSDLFKFNNPKQFVSPLDLVVELADCFLYDRSVRDLQKKYHGFAKAVEPLFRCAPCDGTGLMNSEPCKECTPAGANRGTGYKLSTKVSDVARFPLEMLESVNFDFRKIFGYVTPDIESWNKQDQNLEMLEYLVDKTYWGAARNSNLASDKDNKSEETATKTMINMRPRYAHLNEIADWAERTENMIADFIGRYWFDNAWKGSNIAYGRYYILETPEELMKQYHEMRSKGAPDFSLYEQLEKYYNAVYQNSPIELAVRLKLLYVEPFPHLTVSQVKALAPDSDDYYGKMYFGEWYSTLTDVYIVNPANTAAKLREELRAYVKSKNIQPRVEPEVTPFNNN